MVSNRRTRLLLLATALVAGPTACTLSDAANPPVTEEADVTASPTSTGKAARTCAGAAPAVSCAR